MHRSPRRRRSFFHRPKWGSFSRCSHWDAASTGRSPGSYSAIGRTPCRAGETRRQPRGGPIEPEIVLSAWMWAAATAVMFAAGLTQGALGFGFPAISTSILVLLTDVKTAIILNLLPNFTVNCVSIAKGGNWSASLGRYWPVAAWVMVGAFLGAQFLIHGPQDPIRLLLGLAIIAYLYQSVLARLDWSWLARKKRLSAMLFGLTGGFFSGTVNQSLPPLLIYFTLLGLDITV